MVTVLWRGVFKAAFIQENHIKFDTYIRFAEDWLFYAEYFQYIKSVSVINLPLYHYCQRESSVMHTYNAASLLGLRKSCYILDRFMICANHTGIRSEILDPYIAKRYVGLIVNQAKNVWNHQNPMTIREKKKYLSVVIREANVNERIKTLQYPKLGKIDFFLRNAIYNNNIFIISAYAVLYNTMRDLRNTIRKLTHS